MHLSNQPLMWLLMFCAWWDDFLLSSVGNSVYMTYSVLHSSSKQSGYFPSWRRASTHRTVFFVFSTILCKFWKILSVGKSGDHVKTPDLRHFCIRPMGCMNMQVFLINWTVSVDMNRRHVVFFSPEILLDRYSPGVWRRLELCIRIWIPWNIHTIRRHLLSWRRK